jgi:uncharacterized protein
MENFISIGQFARRVRDVFGNDRRFRYFFHNIARLGGSNDESITVISKQDQNEIEAHLWDASGLARPVGQGEEDYVCYAAKGNSLVIRSTGRLAKCTVALNDSCNDIGWISESGEVCVDQKKYQRCWIVLFKSCAVTASFYKPRMLKSCAALPPSTASFSLAVRKGQCLRT